MPSLYIDLTALLAIWMGGLLLLVALLGLVIRHSGVPFLAALAEYRRLRAESSSTGPVVDRVSRLERRIERLERSAGPRSTPGGANSPTSTVSMNSTAGAA